MRVKKTDSEMARWLRGSGCLSYAPAKLKTAHEPVKQGAPWGIIHLPRWKHLRPRHQQWRTLLFENSLSEKCTSHVGQIPEMITGGSFPSREKLSSRIPHPWKRAWKRKLVLSLSTVCAQSSYFLGVCVGGCCGRSRIAVKVNDNPPDEANESVIREDTESGKEGVLRGEELT